MEIGNALIANTDLCTLKKRRNLVHGLPAKTAAQNEVLSELLEEHTRLKKELGET